MKADQETNIDTPIWLRSLTSVCAFICIASLGWWAFTLPLPGAGASGSLAPRPLLPCVLDKAGFLRGQLYGQIETELNWEGDAMRCDGMYRPEGEGIRLVFDQHNDEDIPGFVIVIGVASARLGEQVNDAPANITIIDQNTGQFYSTGDETRCWTTFGEQLKLVGTTEEAWRIDGLIYCEGVLNALKGNGYLRLGDMQFSGVFKPGIDN